MRPKGATAGEFPPDVRALESSAEGNTAGERRDARGLAAIARADGFNCAVMLCHIRYIYAVALM